MSARLRRSDGVRTFLESSNLDAERSAVAGELPFAMGAVPDSAMMADIATMILDARPAKHPDPAGRSLHETILHRFGALSQDQSGSAKFQKPSSCGKPPQWIFRSGVVL